MKQEDFSALLDLMENSYFSVDEALAVLAVEITETPLEIEDLVLVSGLEPCDRCDKWVSTTQLQGTDEDSLCPECYEES